MNTDVPKQYLSVAGKPVLQHVMDVFCASPEIAHVYVVLGLRDTWMDALILSGEMRFPSDRLTLLRCGGKTRRDSVLNGLSAISGKVSLEDWILVHDAARPGLTSHLLKRLVDAVGNDQVGGMLALPVADTVKRKNGHRVDTVPRDNLWLAQTPQMFRYALLSRALREHPDVTDESAAIESMGFSPVLVEGHLCNSKITRPEDMALLEMFIHPKEKDAKHKACSCIKELT
jgi:2-C-methyl-D-erythritol 4-phosphate cytidylyltransferase